MEHKSSKDRGNEKHLEADKKTLYYYLLLDFAEQRVYEAYLKKKSMSIKENEMHIVTNSMVLLPNMVWGRQIFDMNRLIENAKIRNPNLEVFDMRNGIWKSALLL